MRPFAALALILFVSGCNSGGGDNCQPNDHTICNATGTYWTDSCGTLGDLVEECDCGCNADATVCDDTCDGCQRTADCQHLGANYYCDLNRGECVCAPQCTGKCCGDDGCGGTCPDNCSAGTACDQEFCDCEPVASCNFGEVRCTDNVAESCQGGSWVTAQDCDLIGATCVTGVCEGGCCPGQVLYIDAAGVVVDLGTHTGVAVGIAALAPLTALYGDLATHAAETSSTANGLFSFDCFDVGAISLGLVLLADDLGYDGAGGDFFPTVTGVSSWPDNNAKVCIADVQAFVVSSPLLAGLQGEILDLDPAGVGFIIGIVLDAGLNPIAGATVECSDGSPLTVYYPTVDFSNTQAATSATGIYIIADQLSLTSLIGVAQGHTWDPQTFRAATIPGAAYYIPLIADQ